MDNMTKEQLLQEFPNHKLIVHHVDMDNNITDVFTYYDRVELEEKYLDKYNKNNKQLVLFI